MSGWWFAAGCVGLFLLLWIVTNRRGKRQAAALLQSRPSLTRDQFVDLLSGDCESDIADFLWNKMAPEWSHWNDSLTPHPDDDYLGGLPIDPEEPEDWVRDFCVDNGLRLADLPNWPEEWVTTVRNFARWLSSARRTQAETVAA